MGGGEDLVESRSIVSVDSGRKRERVLVVTLTGDRVGSGFHELLETVRPLSLDMARPMSCCRASWHHLYEIIGEMAVGTDFHQYFLYDGKCLCVRFLGQTIQQFYDAEYYIALRFLWQLMIEKCNIMATFAY